MWNSPSTSLAIRDLWIKPWWDYQHTSTRMAQLTSELERKCSVWDPSTLLVGLLIGITLLNTFRQYLPKPKRVHAIQFPLHEAHRGWPNPCCQQSGWWLPQGRKGWVPDRNTKECSGKQKLGFLSWILVTSVSSCEMHYHLHLRDEKLLSVYLSPVKSLN